MDFKIPAPEYGRMPQNVRTATHSGIPGYPGGTRELTRSPVHCYTGYNFAYSGTGVGRLIKPEWVFLLELRYD
eukprot:2084533-Rhodomonas_salina.2